MPILGQRFNASPVAGRTVVCAPARTTRAAAFALVAVTMGSAGHLLVGGKADWAEVAGAAAGMAVGAWALAGREWRWRGIAALLWAGQLLTHLLIQMPSLSRFDPASGVAHAGHWWPSPTMLLVHALAAGVTAGWLRWGERLVWVAARRTATAAVAAVSAVLRLLNGHSNPRGFLLPGRTRTSWMTPLRRRHQTLRHSVVLRAPPAAS